jgi:hypothetical protein
MEFMSEGSVGMNFGSSEVAECQCRVLVCDVSGRHCLAHIDPDGGGGRVN